MMTLDDFKTKVDLYSADLSRWPTDQVKPALALMKDVRDAQSYFDAALALDEKLRGYAPPRGVALPVLEERILRGVAALPKQKAAPGKLVSGKTSFEKGGGEKGVGEKDRAEKTGAEKSFFLFKAAWIAAPGGGLLAAAVLGFIIGFSPAQQKDTLLDPVYASQSQIIHNDAEISDGGMF